MARLRGGGSYLTFETISIEGGLLSPEWLAKIAQLQAPQQSEGDYRVPKGLNLREEIGRYWRIAQAKWAEFKAGVDAKGDGRALSEKFVPWLLRDAFGFASLEGMEPIRLDSGTFPVGYAALDGQVPVVVAPAAQGLDDPSAELGDGSRRRSAFGLAQEYLNAETKAVWGIATDGLALRVLRDNSSLTRPAWIEVDLARIFAEARYPDFAALWLLLHETRFQGVLETWRAAGRGEGTRAREHLREGVEQALISLGQGFLSHAKNDALRQSLERGTLTTDAFFQQLLRLVYRIIFLLTIEERDVLHPSGADTVARTRFAEGYSLRRLRDRSARRAAHDRFDDLWESLKVTFAGLTEGEPRLGLPALAGLFDAHQCPALMTARIENRALLDGIFKLCWLREDSGLARVNWRDMGPEELGSVYESLLELVPQLGQDGRQFSFAASSEARGNARKTTGSYYTPDSLVQVLLDSALEPVIADTIAKNPANPVEAVLGLSIVDPACGSGHFLLAAAHRLALHLARLGASGTGSVQEYRHVLRQVVSRCVYGVDVNPMAVELCKVNLWKEAVEPGLPLTFLDSHIQCGNALLGTTTELMTRGIPDAAWEPIEGDDNKTASALKKRNKAERADPNVSFEFAPGIAGGTMALTSQVQMLDAASDENVAGLEKKGATWRTLLDSEHYQARRLAADAWCSAFVWPKQPGLAASSAPTHKEWERLRHDPAAAPRELVAQVQALAEQYRFFHWNLQFPQVFAKGGFDVVLGNPPWERVKLQEQEFFASRNDEIASAPNAAARKKLIAALPANDRRLWDEWCVASRRAEGEAHLVRDSGRYPLCGTGDVNTYAIFAEHNRSALGPNGRAGFIVPTGIATDDTTKDFFADLVVQKNLAAFFGFENEAKLFKSIDHRVNFCLLILSRPEVTVPSFSAFIREPALLRDPSRVYQLSATDIGVLNPNTKTCPVFKTRRDAEINLRIYRRCGVFWREGDRQGNPWSLRFMAMLHMANDSGLFRTRTDLESSGHHLVGNHFVGKSGEYLPLVEAKMVYLWNHRFGDFALLAPGEREHILPQAGADLLARADYLTMPRYWVEATQLSDRLGPVWKREWALGWRRVTDARSSVRTLVACVIPRAATGDSFFLALPESEPALIAALLANLSSYVLDYGTRQKLAGVNLNYFVIKQLPVLPPSTYGMVSPWTDVSLREWLLPRIVELTYTALDLEPFASDLGYSGPPYRWDPERRFLLRCELDAAFFHLYGLSRDETDYVMETFPIVRKNDEKAHGEYRTKRGILETYDAIAEAMRTGNPYQTRLDPPPADPRAAHRPRLAALKLPRMPEKMPTLEPAEGMARFVWAVTHVTGGAVRDLDLARAFSLRAQPQVLVQFAPAQLRAAAVSWANGVANRVVATHGLAEILKGLEARAAIRRFTENGQPTVGLGKHTPVESAIDDWTRFEAVLTVLVTRSLAPNQDRKVDDWLSGADRSLVKAAAG